MKNIWALLAIVTCGVLSFSSCSDEPDSDSYYSFNGKMMSEYITSDPNFSDFATIVNRAGLMDQLSAYGHYTCFLPNNEAVQKYLAKKNIASLSALSDADCDTIARTHIMTEIYAVSDMADGMLPTQNMLRRNVQINHDEDAKGNPVIKLNSNSTIYFEHQDDSVENGMVQQIDVVLENSTKSVGSLVGLNEKVSVFAAAMHMTGIDEKLDLIEDRTWAENYKNNKWVKKQDLTTGSRAAEATYCPEQRLFGFTVFAVPDSVLKVKYNVNNVQELYNLAASIYENIYPEDAGKDGWKFENLSSDINPLKRFLLYHILDRNVQGYNFLTVRENAGIDVDVVNPTEWYATMLPHTMMKVEKLTVGKYVGSGVKGDVYLNRRWEGTTYAIEGSHVQPTVEDTYDNNAINGMYFYVDDILKFDETVRDVVQNCRMRMDFSTIFPEIMNNNIRMNGNSVGDDNRGKNYWFPQGYLDGVELKGDSRLTYWYPRSGYWSMNGDEMDAQEVFDITFNIPPVPFTGEWQIRLGFAPMSKADGAERGQVQIYVDGKAQGIPLNMAEPINLSSVYGGAFPAYLSIRDDADKRQEDFKILKNKGYYRGPHSIFNGSTGLIKNITQRFSTNEHTVRKVLCTTTLTAGTTHTIRIKNVSTILPKTKEAMLDYLELVPKSVYGISDGDAQEDDL